MTDRFLTKTEGEALEFKELSESEEIIDTYSSCFLDKADIFHDIKTTGIEEAYNIRGWSGKTSKQAATRNEQEIIFNLPASFRGRKVILFRGVGILGMLEPRKDAEEEVHMLKSEVHMLKSEVHMLKVEVRWLRRLLNDKSSGVGLMRLSFLAGFTFALLFVTTTYTSLKFVHPMISILGFIVSLGFFWIGWLNSKP